MHWRSGVLALASLVVAASLVTSATGASEGGIYRGAARGLIPPPFAIGHGLIFESHALPRSGQAGFRSGRIAYYDEDALIHHTDGAVVVVEVFDSRVHASVGYANTCTACRPGGVESTSGFRFKVLSGSPLSVSSTCQNLYAEVVAKSRAEALAITAVIYSSAERLGMATCSGKPSSQPAVSAKQVLLQPEDVADWTVKAAGQNVAASSEQSGLSLPTSVSLFGRTSGALASWQMSISDANRGPFTLQSRAIVFYSAANAHFAYQLVATAASKYTHAFSTRLGDESIGRWASASSGGLYVQVFTVVWRYKNVMGYVTVGGGSTTTAADAKSAAHAEQAHFAALVH